MIIRSLSIHQWRKFTMPVNLTGMKDGLNILMGKNELGKTTFFEAFYAALFEKHSSKAEEIKQFQNTSAPGAPEVKLTFELEGESYTISKKFLKSAYARLQCPGGTVLKDDVAEEKLQELLHFQATRSNATPESLGVWGMLWVKQGESFVKLELAQSTKVTLQESLEQEVGVVLGGKRGRKIPQKVAEELSKHISLKTQKPTKTFKVHMEQKDNLKQQIQDLEALQSDHKSALDSIQSLDKDIKRLENPKNKVEDSQNIQEAKKDLQKKRDLDAQIREEKAIRDARKLELDAKNKDKEERSKLAQDMKKAEKKIAASNKDLKEASEKLQSIAQELEEVEASLKNQKGLEKTIAKDLENIESFLELLQKENALKTLSKALQEIQDLEIKQSQALKLAESIKITQSILESIEESFREKTNHKSQMQAISTRIGLDLEDYQGMTINDNPINPKVTSLYSIEKTTISIPKRGSITIEPSIKDKDELKMAMKQANTRYNDLLEQADVDSVEMARKTYQQKKQALEDAKLAKKQIHIFIQNLDNPDIRNAQLLSDHIHKQQEHLSRKQTELQAYANQSLKEAEASILQKEKELEDIQKEVQDSVAKIQGLMHQQSHHTAQKQKFTELTDEYQSSFEEKKQKLLSLENHLKDEDLQKSIAQIRSDYLNKEEKLKALIEQQEYGGSVEQAQERLHRLEEALDNKEEKLQKKKTEKQVKLSKLEHLGGLGLGEQLKIKKRDLDIQANKCRRIDEEVQILEYLLNTLTRAEREVKEHFMLPISRRLRPYLQALFPGCEFSIDEKLEITEIKRDRHVAESFSILSMGTREQIAILVRLAFAELLVEQGKPTVVVLDDALVYSDDTRINHMFDILRLAAKKFQIIVFTCREDLFEEAGGHLLALESSK